MKAYNLENMSGGWFIGGFEPRAYEWNGGEVAVKHYKKGVAESFVCYENAVTFYALIKGKLIINGETIETGQIAIFEKGDVISLSVIEDTDFVLGIIGDCHRSRFNNISIENIKKVHDPLYPHKKYAGEISSEDICVVVQGAINEQITPLCLQSIRKYLPESRIILSTWEGECVEGLDYDELIFNKDPGGFHFWLDSINQYVMNNNNRQLVSTQSGLAKVDSEYVLKLRTDMIMMTDEWLTYFDDFAERKDEYRLFDKKVIVSDIYSRHSIKGKAGYFPTPFFVSDWFFFGLTDDIKKYFMHTRLMTEEEMTKYSDLKNENYKEIYGNFSNPRYFPEQYFCVQAAMNYFNDINMNDWTDVGNGNIKKSEKFILNNFIMLDFSRHGILLPKYEKIITSNCAEEDYDIQGLYSFEKYSKAYERLLKDDSFSGIWKEEDYSC